MVRATGRFFVEQQLECGQMLDHCVRADGHGTFSCLQHVKLDHGLCAGGHAR